MKGFIIYFLHQKYYDTQILLKDIIYGARLGSDKYKPLANRPLPETKAWKSQACLERKVKKK
jgi:hypothetical protein